MCRVQTPPSAAVAPEQLNFRAAFFSLGARQRTLVFNVVDRRKEVTLIQVRTARRKVTSITQHHCAIVIVDRGEGRERSSQRQYPDGLLNIHFVLTLRNRPCR